jgi:hypothetical protein
MAPPRLDRRTFLRASGIAIGLPFLEAMIPASAAEAKKSAAQQSRMVLIGQPLGMFSPNFFPTKAGRDYEASRYLKSLQAHRDQFTVFSGMSHRYAAGHFAECGLFTGVHSEMIRYNEIKNGISLDQEAASHIGNQTRFASLNLGGGDFVWNRRGVRVPSETRATQVFKKLFIAGTANEEKRELQKVKDGQSILDDVGEQIKSLNRRVSSSDRSRLDLFLSGRPPGGAPCGGSRRSCRVAALPAGADLWRPGVDDLALQYLSRQGTQHVAGHGAPLRR